MDDLTRQGREASDKLAKGLSVGPVFEIRHALPDDMPHCGNPACNCPTERQVREVVSRLSREK